MPPARHDVAAQFADEGYVVIRRLIGGRLLSDLHDHSLAVAAVLTEMATKGEIRDGDPVVPGTPAYYSDVCMEALLARIKPRIERLVAHRLYPTYSYFRVYKRGDVLPAHHDRPACEISISLSLGFIAAKPWPLWIRGFHGTRSVSLAPGDAVIYQGIKCVHWRKAFRGTRAAQLFLHYVDRDGPRASWRYDRRARLGTRRSFPLPASLVRARLS